VLWHDVYLQSPIMGFSLQSHRYVFQWQKPVHCIQEVINCVCKIYILGGGSPNHYPLCALGLDACLHRGIHMDMKLTLTRLLPWNEDAIYFFISYVSRVLSKITTASRNGTVTQGTDFLITVCPKF
jgi:hypothetical protein